MACECGAAKTYKAPPKSMLHSDWCVDSPAYKPKPVKFVNDFKFVFGGFPQGVQNVMYAGSLPAPKAPAPIPCEPGCPNGAMAEYKIDYPKSFMSFGAAAATQFAGKTKYFCGGCTNPLGHASLRSQGCTVTKL